MLDISYIFAFVYSVYFCTYKFPINIRVLVINVP